MTTLHALSLRGGAALAALFAAWLLIHPVRLRAEGIWLQSHEALACFLAVSLLLCAPLLVAARRAWREGGRIAAGRPR